MRLAGPRSTRLSRVVALAVLATLAVVAYVSRVQYEMRDFQVYWEGGRRVLAAESLFRAEDGHYVFKYLPAFAIAVAPWSLLPLRAAQAVWFGLSVIGLTFVLQSSARLLPGRRRPTWLLVVAAIVALGKFYGHELVLGQVNLAVTALAIGALGAFRRNRDGWAGALLGASVAVKPYGIILLPYLVVTRQRRAAACLASVVVAALVAPVVAYGPSGAVEQHRLWLATIVGSTPSTLVTQDNISLFAMFGKWFGVGPIAWSLGFLSVAVMVGLVALVIARRPASEAVYLEIALLLMLVPIVSPQGWDYMLVMATPAVMLVVDRIDRLPRALGVSVGLALLAMGLSLFDVLGRTAYAAVMRWSLVTICALVIVAGVGVLRNRRLA